MSTFCEPALGHHNTDWTGHVHVDLGWVGFIVFGMLYWIVPKLYKVEKLHSENMANFHFWMATVGIVLYVVTMWIAGIMQGMMWFQFTDDGRLAYSDWMEILDKSKFFYVPDLRWHPLPDRLAIMCLYNLAKTAPGSL